jgi:membrane-associated phospholipid phosphatase
MIVLEAVFILAEWLRISCSPEYMIWLVPGPVPLAIALGAAMLEGNNQADQEPSEWIRWAIAGIIMFSLWASTYFLAGLLTEPSRVRYLSVSIESNIPMRPNYSLLYLLLYPIFMLPFFIVRKRAHFYQLIVADAFMLLICTVIFLAVPVAFERPPLLTPPSDFGTWVLLVIRGADPAWNCMPSEHCAAAMIAALSTREASRKWGIFAFVATIGIGISTLFTKQHYLGDVLAGYGLAFALHYGIRWFGVSAFSSCSCAMPLFYCKKLTRRLLSRGR